MTHKFCCFAVGSLLAAFTTLNAQTDDAERAMRAREFKNAISHLEKAKPGEYTSYLKAVSLYQLGKHSESIAECKSLLEKFPETEWSHKTRFLMARA